MRELLLRAEIKLVCCRAMSKTADSYGPSDEELMSLLTQGDQEALAALYRRHSPSLFSVAFRITGDAGSAEELLQDTFFQLWEKASQFNTARGSLIGWLLTITRHRAISHLRRNAKGTLCDSLDDFSGISQDGRVAWMEEEIARELVSVALAGLPKAQAQAITFAYFEGLTCEEIAQRTGTPVGTTKNRLRMALTTMRRRLSNPGSAKRKTAAGAPATLDDILITDELLRRPCRPRRLQHEEEHLRRLTQAASAGPEKLIQSLLEIPAELCRAGSAGLSLLDTQNSPEPVFRWTNLAGQLASYVGGTTPRNFSPCGVTLDRNAPQLFAYPARYFQYFREVEIPIVEGLVIPFRVGTRTEGTIWIVSHTPELKFDSEDVRIMKGFAEFVGCAIHVTRSFTPELQEKYSLGSKIAPERSALEG